MPIRVSCPCGKLLQVKDELAGRKVKCPACGNPLVVRDLTVEDDSRTDQRDDEAVNAVSISVRESEERQGMTNAGEGHSQKMDKQARGTSGRTLGIAAGGGLLVLGAWLLTWIFSSSGPSWAEEKAVEFVKKLNGRVTRDENLPGNPVTVSLLNTPVTDAGLKELAGLKTLTSLDLGGTEVTDAGLKELAGLKNLTILSLYNTQMTDAGLKELAGLKNLTFLNLNETQVTDAGVKELQQALPKCRTIMRSSIRRRSSVAEERAVEYVKQLNGQVTRYENLPGGSPVIVTLGGPKVTDAGLKELAALRNLTSLELSNTPVTDAGLKELAALENLTTLSLSGTPVTGEGLKELAGLKNLTSLNLSLAPVADAGLKELAGLKNLTTLSLDGTQVTDAGLKEIAGLKNLTLLFLSGTQVTDAGLKELAGLKNLTTLSLGNTKVTDAGVKELAGLKNLTSLYLFNTQVTDAGVKELQQALPKCQISK